MQKALKGFTLVETLVSLFILSIALTGAFTVISSNLRTAHFIQHSFIANGLAQEGLEVVRNLRDSDWFTGAEFGSLGSDDGEAMADGTYQVQWNSASLLSLANNPALSKNPDNPFYDYDGSVPTIFTRTVELTRTVNLSGEVASLKITVKVSWPDAQGSKEISATEHLFNWY